MKISHRIKLLLPRLKWFLNAKEEAERFAEWESLYEDLKKQDKELEVRYNDRYRRNPTHHETLILQGRREMLNDILNGDRRKR